MLGTLRTDPRCVSRQMNEEMTLSRHAVPKMICRRENRDIPRDAISLIVGCDNLTLVLNAALPLTIHAMSLFDR
jgi:hypothetical protein